MKIVFSKKPFQHSLQKKYKYGNNIQVTFTHIYTIFFEFQFICKMKMSIAGGALDTNLLRIKVCREKF